MSVPTNLIPTKITGLPEYTGTSQAGYFPYVLEGTTYKVQFSSVASSGEVPPSRTITAGTGLVGGGDLSANRIFAIANGGVGANQLDTTGVVAGVYGNGSNVPTVTVDANGRVTSVTTSPVVATGYVPESRTITAGTGLIGGGSLAGNITLSLNISSATPQALGNATAGVSTAAARGDHVHPAVNLGDTNQTQGALPLGRGGTGDALSPVAGAVVYSTGTKLAMTNPGTAGQVLVSGGADEPEWRTIAGLGTVTSVNASGGSTGMTFTGGPITTSGTLTLGGTLATGSGGTGLTGTPTNGQLLIGNGTGYALSTLTAGTAVSITNAAGSITIDNTAPDQIVSLTAGTAISVTGTYPNFTIGNTAPDQIVSLTGAGTTTISGTYPNFTITSNDQFTGTVTSVAASGGTTGLTFSGSPITSAGTLTLGGTLAVANGGTGATTASGARTNLGAAASGANSDITSLSGITGGIGTADFVAFDTTNVTPPTTGQIAWSVDDGTLDVGLYGGSILKVGQQTLFYAKNTSGGTIPIGTPVMFTGVVGASGKLTFGLAVANGSVPPEYMMGVTTQNVVNNDFGYITSFGLVRGFNTSGAPYGETWADGDLLYFSPVTPGGWTKVEPQAPNIHVPVAVVVNAATGGSGSIFVRMIQSERLGELQDVEINGGGPAAGQVLIYDPSQSRWENNTLTAGSNVTITNGNGSITIAATEQFTGTVTSVAASGGTTGLTFSGSPITSAGTLTLGGTLAIGSGGTGATTAGGARTALGAAGSGANTDITSIALTSGTILNAPTSGTDIVNKAYADSIAAGINFHQSVRLATVAPLPANTYNNGSSGVGATLTGNANGALSIDGVAVVAGNRVLVKDEVAQANNGVYVVTQTGSGSTPYILTRATDFDSAGSGVDQIDAGDFFLVTAGNTLANTSWVQQTPLPITVGTTAIVFSQFGAPVLYSAGTGLSLAGTVFSIANTGVSASTYGSASQVPVLAVNAQGQITSASNTSISIAASQVTSGSLAVARGGTGLSTTPTNGQLLIGNGTGYSLSTLSAGTGISVSNGSGSVTVTNTAPDQIVTITGGGATVVTGTYPNFTVSTTTGTGTVTSVDVSGGSTGLSFTGGPITSSGIITMGGTLGVANGGTGATTLSSGYLLKGNGTSAVSASVIYDDGTNVGIGTTSVNLASGRGMQINAPAGQDTRLKLTNVDSGTGSFDGFDLGVAVTGAVNLIGWEAQPMSFFTSGTERMRITAAGDVGIGTSSPTQILTLAAANNFPFIHWNNASNTTIAFAGWHGGTGGGDDFRLGTNSTRAVAFHTNNTERMRVTAAGNVGIGLSAPSYLLHVGGRIASQTSTSDWAFLNDASGGAVRGGLWIGSGGDIGVANATVANGWFASSSVAYAITNFSERMRIDSSGNLGIGTSSPGRRLDVVGGDARINGATVGRGGSDIISNTAMGNSALNANTTGAANTAVGFTALLNNTTGNNQTAVGHQALYFNTTGGQNTAVGQNALVLNTTGSSNAATGFQALLNNTTGNDNTAVGLNALLNNTTGTGNTAIGSGAGSALTTGNNNTIIGRVAGTAGLSDTVIIAAGTTERVRIDSSGNVGIGTSSPGAPLQVVGAGRFGAGPGDATNATLAMYNDGTGVSIEAFQGNNVGVKRNLWLNAYGGNVGIGTSAPGQRLEVSGSIAVTGGGNIFSNSTASTWGIAGGNAFNNGGGITVGGSTSSVIAGGIYFSTGTGATNTERMRIDGSGNVGIGTSSPGALLDVSGTIRVGAGSTDPGTGGVMYLVGSGAFQTVIGGAAFAVHTGANNARVERARITSDGSMQLSVGGVSNTHQFLYNESGGEIQLVDSTGAGPILIDNSGGLARFYKVGSGAISVGTTGANYFQFITNGAERMRINSDGNVGIGTSSIASLLHVKLGSNAIEVYPSGTWATRVINAVDGVANNGLLVGNRWAGTGSTVFEVGSIFGGGTGSWYSYYRVDGTGQSFWSNGGTERMRLNSSGNVGIGMSNPVARLNVAAAGQVNAPVLGNVTNYPAFFSNNDSGYGLGIGTNGSDGHVWLQAQRADSAVAYNITLNEAGGSVGIGTSSPRGRLTVGAGAVGGNPTYSGDIVVRSGMANLTSQGGLEFQSTTFSNGYGFRISTPDFGGGSTPLVIESRSDSAAWTERMRVTAAGNVGIGTSNPTERLDTGSGNTRTQALVISGDQHLFYGASATEFGFRVGASGPFYGIGTTGSNTMRINSSSGGDMLFAIGSTERARITSLGNVGIGISNPAARLQVREDLDGTTGVVIQNRNGSGTPVASLRFITGGLDLSDNRWAGITSQGVTAADLRFFTSSGGPVERFRITSTGAITSSDLADAVGYKGIPQNAQTASYTLALSDIGRHISITTGGVTIPANGSVAFPIGSAITIYNNSASNQTISITSDTLRLAGTATTGSRTLAQRGICTCVKVAATEWVISGAGLT